MEALILAVIVTYAIRKMAEDAHLHWQGSKAANRKATRGQPLRQRAASAARHDAAYWARQVRGGFPQVRHGLYMGWHAGRIAQLEGRQERAQAKAEHAHLRARVTEAVREQRRRQDEALQRIRAAAAGSEPEPQAAGEGRQPTRRLDGQPETRADTRFFSARESGYAGWINQDGYPVPDPSTEGTVMSGDVTYTQQMTELAAIRRDAEEASADTARRRMTSRLDILQAMGLDKDSLSEAAAIDDALQALEKAARQLLDAADAAIAGLSKRHGGIKAAVDDAPVDKPAGPEFYQD